MKEEKIKYTQNLKIFKQNKIKFHFKYFAVKAAKIFAIKGLFIHEFLSLIEILKFLNMPSTLKRIFK